MREEKEEEKVKTKHVDESALFALYVRINKYE